MNDFRTVMNFYYRAAAHAWDEDHIHHIGYKFTVPDLLDDAAYAQAAVLMQRGEWDKARKTLALFKNYRGDFTPGALFLMGRCHEKLGDAKQAFAAYQQIAQTYPQCGLADDAQLEMTRLQQGKTLDFGSPLPGGHDDVFWGENVAIHIPFLDAPRVRSYNLPNIWDAAHKALRWWTSAPPSGRETIVLGNRGIDISEVATVLPVETTLDPPDWQSGLRVMAQKFVAAPEYRALSEANPVLRDAFVQFAAASLHYNLVSETRDTIGSASSTKLAHEDVIRLRDAATRSLQAYIQEGAKLDNLSPEAAGGMLITLLNDNGFGQSGLVDWSPFRKFFTTLRDLPEEKRAVKDREAASNLLVHAFNRTFNADLTDTFRSWGFPVDKEKVQKVASR